ncbi:MAG: hypothetical protein LBE17_00195 [Treponema sp.]|jgi:hypothetical protein|nr:hypothetical protein [Treponema sp.]
MNGGRSKPRAGLRLPGIPHTAGLSRYSAGKMKHPCARPEHAAFRAAFPVPAASLFTALAPVRKRNSLLSIFGGTAVYRILGRMAGR